MWPTVENMNMAQSTNASFTTAAEIARAIYRSLDESATHSTWRRDGVEVITLGDARLRIYDDGPEVGGIAWWLDHGDELAVESGGWAASEFRPPWTVQAEIDGLVEILIANASAGSRR